MLASDLSVGGIADITSTLSVGEATVLASTLSVNGTTVLASDLSVGGIADITSNYCVCVHYLKNDFYFLISSLASMNEEYRIIFNKIINYLSSKYPILKGIKVNILTEDHFIDRFGTEHPAGYTNIKIENCKKIIKDINLSNTINNVYIDKNAMILLFIHELAHCTTDYDIDMLINNGHSINFWGSYLALIRQLCEIKYISISNCKQKYTIRNIQSIDSLNVKEISFYFKCLL